MATVVDPQVRTNWKSLDIRSLESLANSRAGSKSISKLRGQDAAAIADLLDQILDLPQIDPRRKRRHSLTLRKLCGACGILPTSHTLPEGIELISERPQSSGGYADVWMGRHKGRLVAVKALKIYASDDLNLVKRRFCKEALVWKRLSHPNVLSFLGVATFPQFSFCMVSNWMQHGNIICYINSHPEANRPRFLSDVANGLDYLHVNELVHGDLKGVNILVNDNLCAVIADFGLAAVMQVSTTSLTAMTNSGGVGTVRWMAPELLIPEEYGLTESRSSKQSDIYAFAMVIYELVSGNVPFSQYNAVAVIPKVMSGARPERPTDAESIGLSDTLWLVVERCWNQESKERPDIHVVLEDLNFIAQQWIPPTPVIPDSCFDGDDDSDGSGWFSTTCDEKSYVYLPDIDFAAEHAVADVATTALAGHKYDPAKAPRYAQDRMKKELTPSPLISESKGRKIPQFVDPGIEARSRSEVLQKPPTWIARPRGPRALAISSARRTDNGVIESDCSLHSNQAASSSTRALRPGKSTTLKINGSQEDTSALSKQLIHLPVGLSQTHEAMTTWGPHVGEGPSTPRNSGKTLGDLPDEDIFVQSRYTLDSRGDGAVMMLCESPDAIEQLNISVEDWIKGQLFLAYIAKLVNLVVMFTLRDSVQWELSRFSAITWKMTNFMKNIGYAPQVAYLPLGGVGDGPPDWYEGWQKDTKHNSANDSYSDDMVPWTGMRVAIYAIHI